MKRHTLAAAALLLALPRLVMAEASGTDPLECGWRDVRILLLENRIAQGPVQAEQKQAE